VNPKPTLRVVSGVILCAVFFSGLFAPSLTRYPYALQLREAPNARPSAAHPLGTDSLGRDSFSRLAYGTRVSLLLAPAAALMATLIAGLFGGVAGLSGGWCEKAILSTADLAMALPLLFVLIALRALLPLDVSPLVSVVATFVTLGALGWPSSLRVVWAAARSMRDSDYLMLARANGVTRARILWRHAMPNLRPVLLAQFWISIPLFILTEATLSMLGLGVMEPLPSWGNLLRNLEDFSAVRANPWMLSPLLLLILVVICFQTILPLREN